MGQYLPLLLRGTVITIIAWICATIISLTVGGFLGMASCKRLSSTTARWIIKSYTFIAKGIPAYVQILIAYFVIPGVLSINIPASLAAIGALSFCSSGYVTEIVRAGINSIAEGQWDAAFVLGYSTPQTLARIILPQVLKNILPSLLGETEQLLKSTALLATVGVTELTRTGMNIISRELNPIPVYLLVACIYLLLSALVHYCALLLEKKVSYGNN